MSADYLASNILPPFYHHGDVRTSVRLAAVTGAASTYTLPEAWIGAYLSHRAEGAIVYFLYVDDPADTVAIAASDAVTPEKLGEPIMDGETLRRRALSRYIALVGTGVSKLRIGLTSQGT